LGVAHAQVGSERGDGEATFFLQFRELGLDQAAVRRREEDSDDASSENPR
jgi:hypothetical protein